MMIGFIGTPSCGKSTTAFGLCYHLKKAGYPVELVVEHARRRIIECRLQGIPGNGGMEGQKSIYATDLANTEFYRQHADSVCIMDGCTLNCHFYGIDDMNFEAEAARYDLLFYIPMTDIALRVRDMNRIHDTDTIRALAARWEHVVRPLMEKCPHIVELSGYPHANEDQMVAAATKIVLDFLEKKKPREAA